MRRTEPPCKNWKLVCEWENQWASWTGDGGAVLHYEW
jgi:hypothetical protein